MRYIILSIDDSRKEKKQNIRKVLSPWSESFIECINGYKMEELKSARLLTGIKDAPMLAGELGVWYSTANAWINVANNGPAVVLEDDALLREDFIAEFDKAIEDLPEDADFLSLFIPYNQTQDFYYMVSYDEEGLPNIQATGVPEKQSIFYVGSQQIAKAYMGYGNVAIYYTQKGAHKLLNIAKERGIYTPVDCFLYLQAHSGNINGYALHPRLHGLVDVDWQAETLIHTGNRIELGE